MHTNQSRNKPNQNPLLFMLLLLPPRVSVHAHGMDLLDCMVISYCVAYHRITL